MFVWGTWSQLATAWLVGYTGVQLAIEVNNYIIGKKIKCTKLVKISEEESQRNEKGR